jgi:hypothetical protein
MPATYETNKISYVYFKKRHMNLEHIFPELSITILKRSRASHPSPPPTDAAALAIERCSDEEDQLSVPNIFLMDNGI